MAYLVSKSKEINKIKLSKSAIATLDLLKSSKAPLCVKEITDELPYSSRTIYYALNQLKSYALIERKDNFLDLRESIYLPSEKASLYGFNLKSL